MNLKSWWRGFVARNVCAADPVDAARDAAAVRPQDVLAQPTPIQRMIWHPCRRPDKTVRYTAQWIRDGRDVERMSTEQVRISLAECQCPKKAKPSKQEALAL